MTMPYGEELLDNTEQEEQPVEQVIELPAGQEIPEGYEEVPKEEKPKVDNDTADLFEVPQPEDSDIYTDDLFELDDEDIGLGEEEGTEDLFELNGDLGSPLPPKKKKIRRATRRSTFGGGSPTSIRGISV